MTIERIDLDAITELKDILEDEFEELISTYIQDIQKKMNRLIDAVIERNTEEVRELAHSIKGASVNIGIMKLGDLCQRLEVSAKAGVLDDFDELLSLIQDEVQWVLQALTEL